MNTENKTSTFLTGGGGFSYEDKIGVFYLSMLLKEGLIPELSNSVITKISFQQANQGNPLDDFIITARNLSIETKLSLQAKHDISFGNNPEFVKVINACITLFNDPGFNKYSDRFGIVVGIQNANIDKYYKQGNILACNVTNGEEFIKLVSTQSKTFLNFFNVVKNILEQKSLFTNEYIWNFFKCFLIIYIPFNDYTVTINNINDVMQDSSKSQMAYNLMLSYTNRCRIAGGTIDKESLISILLKSNIDMPINKSSKYALDQSKIKEFTNSALSIIKQDINGIQADRVTLLNEIWADYNKSNLLIIHGHEGVGKSSILKSLAEKITERNDNIIVFSDKIMNSFNDGGWQGLSNYLRLTSSLKEVLLTSLQTGKTINIFIDGADFIIKSEKQLAIAEVLSELRKLNEKIDFILKVVVTSRSIKDTEWLKLLIKTPTLITREIHFDPNENEDFLKKLKINNMKALSPLFSNLFFIETITKIPQNEPPTTEWEIAKLWWNEYIKETAFKKALLDFTVAIASAPDTWISWDTDAIVKDDLIGKSILMKTEYESYYTRHDIYRDWLLAIYFDKKYSENKEGFCSFVKNANDLNLIYYLKPFALFSSRLLIEGKFEEWINLYTVYSAPETNPIWEQALLESIFLITDDKTILSPFLNNVKNKREIINEILNFLYSAKISGINNQIVIDYKIWWPFIVWLSENATDINDPAKIHEIFSLWRYFSFYAGDLCFSKIADIYKLWLGKSREGEHFNLHEKDILRELIFLSKYRPKYIEEELNKKFNSTQIIDVFMSEVSAKILIDQFPREYASFIVRNTTITMEELDEKLGEWPYGVSMEYQEEKYYLFKYFIFYDYTNVITYGAGPFTYFLERHDDIAITLIQELSDHAINSLLYNNILKSSDYLKVNIGGIEYIFYGKELEYLWFRPLQQIPIVLNLAFVALENWFRNQIENGMNLEEIALKLIRKDAKNPIALLGIFVSVAMEFTDISKDLMCELASKYILWDYDFKRHQKDIEMKIFKPYAYNIPEVLLKKYQDNYNENENRKHRKLLFRDFYLPILLQNKTCRDRMMNNISEDDLEKAIFSTEEEKRLHIYKIQLLGMDAHLRQDKEGQNRYVKLLKELTSDDANIKKLKIDSYVLTLPQEPGKLITLTDEDLKTHFENLQSIYDYTKENTILLDNVLSFLLLIFKEKRKFLEENKYPDFLLAIVYSDIRLLKNNKIKSNDIFLCSITRKIAAILAIKIYSEFPKHKKEDLEMLYGFLLETGMNDGRSCSEYVFDSLNTCLIEDKKITFYINLINLLNENYIRSPKDTLNGNNKIDNNKIISKYTNYKTSNISRIMLNSNKRVLSEYFPVLLFISKHFDFFNRLDKKFSDTYYKNVTDVLTWNINLSKIGYKNRRYPQEYPLYYECLHTIIFDTIKQYPKNSYDKYIKLLIDNAEFTPILASCFLLDFFRKDCINNNLYVNILKKAYIGILDKGKLESSTTINFIENILFMSFGERILEDDWGHFSEFTNIITKWVEIYGNTFHYYSVFLKFIYLYHSKYSISNIMSWLNTIINESGSQYYGYETLFKRNNWGNYTLTVMKLLKNEYPNIMENAQTKKIFINIINKLVICNVLGAIELQNSILARKEGA